jgi:hypothetical protein
MPPPYTQRRDGFAINCKVQSVGGASIEIKE